MCRSPGPPRLDDSDFHLVLAYASRGLSSLDATAAEAHGFRPCRCALRILGGFKPDCGASGRIMRCFAYWGTAEGHPSAHIGGGSAAGPPRSCHRHLLAPCNRDEHTQSPSLPRERQHPRATSAWVPESAAGVPRTLPTTIAGSRFWRLAERQGRREGVVGEACRSGTLERSCLGHFGSATLELASLGSLENVLQMIRSRTQGAHP